MRKALLVGVLMVAGAGCGAGADLLVPAGPDPAAETTTTTSTCHIEAAPGDTRTVEQVTADQCPNAKKAATHEGVTASDSMTDRS